MLNHEFPPVGGGASPVSFELCTHLAKLGHHVDVVTMHYKDTARFERVNGFNIYRTPAMRRKPDICYPYELATYVPGAFFKALQLARENKYDIIHCHFVVPGGILAWLISRLTQTPYIITCHGSDVPGHNPERFILLHKIVKPFWKFIVNKASGITAPSNFLAKKINVVAPKANVTIIQNGIDSDRFNPTLEKDKKILLCSRILKFKGFQYVLQAVKDMDSGWQIDIVGDGPYLPELKRKAQDVKMQVEFHGWVERGSKQFYSLYDKASVFVFPSTAESFGMVVAEAMAAGCAVIASDIPAHREVLGDAGLYVELHNAQQIQLQLEKLTGDDKLRYDLTQKARERVMKKFSWPQIAGGYIKFYREINKKL